MLKPFRAGAIAVALLTVGGGVAAADPVKVPDVAQYVDTVDGWRLSASLTAMTINAVPNMAATAFSREGFVSGLATQTIEGSSSVPVDKGTLRLWVQLGCQIDLRTGVTLTGGMESAIATGLGLADILGTPVIGADPSAAQSVTPSISATLRPGSIWRAELAKKDFEGPPAGTSFHIAVRDTQVKVDGCGGPVSVRLIATAWMSTSSSDNWVNAYGDIFQI